MNSVTKNVKMSLKLTGLALLSSVLIIGCSEESNNKRKSLAIYQGAPKAEKAKGLGIDVKDDVPAFEVKSENISAILTDEEIAEIKAKLNGEKLSGQELVFKFSFSDKKLIKLKKDEKISLTFFDGVEAEQITGWTTVKNIEEDLEVENDKGEIIKKKPTIFTFELRVQTLKNVQAIKSNLNNLSILISRDKEPNIDKPIKVIDLAELCDEHPENFLNQDTKESGCESL